MTTNKKKKKNTGKSSKKSRSKKIKVSEQRQRSFEAEGATPEVQVLGTKSEYSYSKIIAVIFGILLICGVVMIFCGITDENLKIKIGPYEFSGSMVGLVVILVCGVVLYYARPKVKLTK